MTVKYLGLFALLLALVVPPAQAEEDAPESATPTLKRTDDISAEDRLLELSAVLGALHHLVPICAPATGERWRDRMMELIRLEKPSTAQKNEMVKRFNASFTETSKAFPVCNFDAEEEGRKRAARGEELARSLSARIN